MLTVPQSGYYHNQSRRQTAWLTFSSGFYIPFSRPNPIHPMDAIFTSLLRLSFTPFLRPALSKASRVRDNMESIWMKGGKRQTQTDRDRKRVFHFHSWFYVFVFIFVVCLRVMTWASARYESVNVTQRDNDGVVNYWSDSACLRVTNWWYKKGDGESDKLSE